MYTSDIDANSKSALKTALVYLLASLFCVLFGAVYELFGHGVYSYFMIYAFVFPLAGGTLPFFLLGFARVKKYPRALRDVVRGQNNRIGYKSQFSVKAIKNWLY